MNPQTAERIEIAKSFTPFYLQKKSGFGSRKKMFQKTAFLDYPLSSLMLILSILASGMAFFEFGFFFQKWQNAGLLVLMTMALSFRSPFAWIELMLDSHIKKLESHPLEFDKGLNSKLKAIIEKYAQRKKHLPLYQLPSLLIFLAAFLQVFELNPYWNHFSPFVLLVSLYLLVDINRTVFLLRRNLRKIFF